VRQLFDNQSVVRRPVISIHTVLAPVAVLVIVEQMALVFLSFELM